MIDIHTHLLVGVDDGSTDLELSVARLRMMKEVGVQGVVLTSHYMRGSYDNTSNILTPKFKALKGAALSDDNEIDLYQGYEVYLAPGVANDIVDYNLTMNGTRYVLVETDLNAFPTDFKENLFQIVRKGYKPILAHAERYVNVIHHLSEADDLINRNVYLQVNAASLLGGYGRKVKQAAWGLLENGWVHFVASDDHCKNPYYSLHVARAIIAESIDELTADLLTKVFPGKMIAGSDIPYRYVDITNERRKKSFLKRLFG
ncbi:MAG TPA: capsular biosynthesis protein [Candidatus Cloacimonadota bacterium]|nr:capsular biosynthesis protein [Candidatus Cloacimonadota bacterium]HPT71851.1 capsular biosynthesis protein [Candidatus Cloacimonadota bacterium]